MKKRSIIALTLLLLCVILAASGCSGGGSDSSGGGSDGSSDGPVISFVTEDLDGNELTSEEIFGANEYTMVNCWASWCGPCVRELPELAAMSEEFGAKGCAIVGVLLDADDPKGLADGLELLDEAGAEYLNIKMWDSLASDMNIQAVPTSFFVDSEGRLVGDVIVGAYTDRYAEMIDSLLGK